MMLFDLIQPRTLPRWLLALTCTIGLNASTIPALLADDSANAVTPTAMAYPLAVATYGPDAVYVADRLLPGIWQLSPQRLAIFAKGEKQFRTPLNAIRTVAVGPDGAVFAGDSATREIYRIAPGENPTPLTGGAIGIPIDIAVNRDGVLYVSDLESHQIWRVPADGSPAEKFVAIEGPRGLFLDDSDLLWAVASGSDAPLVTISATGEIEPVVKSPEFEFPHDVVVDSNGRIFVSDNYAACIWQVAPDGSVSTFLTDDLLLGPVGLDLRGDELIIADPKARSVFSVSLSDSQPEKQLRPLHSGH